ncbi:MAG: cytochrome b [Parvularculaceae bacterium]
MTETAARPTNGDSERYTRVAVVLHWLIALMIVGQLAGGLFMVNLGQEQSSLKFQLFQWHKTFGITVLTLSLVRLGWRLTHKPPALPAGMSRWERRGARFSHIGFYVLMIATPFLGWLYVSASPFAESVPTYLFGVIPWPHIPGFAGLENRNDVAAAIAETHEIFAFAIIGLLALHIAAALKHHFKDRDDVLARMVPGVRRRA